LRLELILAVVVALAPVVVAGQPAAPSGAVPTRDEVQKARDKLELDPNLAAVRAVNMLRWAEPEASTDEPWWWRHANAIGRWFRGLFGWLAESGRFVVWVLGALLAVLVAVHVARLVRTGRLPRSPKPVAAPSHVRSLDIRPESLPEDIGAGAHALWQRGEQRAALALLYRGALSRLVHVHGVPIRASSTEGECLALARPRLAEVGARYVASLVTTWGAAVYGGVPPAASAVESLCRDFPTLDRAAGET
jgi:hypothetical protein